MIEINAYLGMLRNHLRRKEIPLFLRRLLKWGHMCGIQGWRIIRWRKERE